MSESSLNVDLTNESEGNGESKRDLKKLIRKYLNGQTVVFSILILGTLAYYAKCFITNKVITFGQKDTVFLLGWIIMVTFVLAFCLYLILVEGKKKDKMIEGLLSQLLEQGIEIKTQNKQIITQGNKVLVQNEVQYDGILRSNMDIAELILDR